MKKLTSILQITGLFVLGMGVLLSMVDLLGWYEDTDKLAVLNWANTPGVGLSIEHPGAKKFMEEYPPPQLQGKNVTHLTKQVVNSALGGKNMQVSINYMYSDTTRSEFVANLADIKDWVEKTPYPLVAWILSAIGFVEVLASYLIGRITKRAEPAN